jgi:hypothetical protein
MQNTFVVINAVKLKALSNEVLCYLRDSIVSPCDDGTTTLRMVNNL